MFPAPDPAPHTGNRPVTYLRGQQYTVPVRFTDVKTGKLLGIWSETCEGPIGHLRCVMHGRIVSLPTMTVR